MRRPRTVVAVVASCLLLTGCNLKHKSSSSAATPTATPTPSATATPTPTMSSAVDPASVNANELGEVPVFMYHQVKANPAGGYDQSPEHFKAELQTLYDMKFRPVTAADFIAGKLNVPAGMHPMVMTFDDGTTSQAGLDPSGNPKPDTALGMMEDFNKSHPDWHSTATFYVNDNPFQDPKVLPWLVAHGYDVGVHTKTHANLKQEPNDAAVEKEVGGNYQDIQAALPGFKITSMALPLGIAPVNRQLAYRGTYNGQSYDMAGVMLVGSDPSASPFASKFDPLFIHRIRSGPGGVVDDADFWIDKFKAHPEVLYTSDGNPDKISFPATKQSQLAVVYQSQANPYGSSSTSAPGSSASPSASPSHSASPTPSHSASSSPSPSGSASSSPSPSHTP